MSEKMLDDDKIKAMLRRAESEPVPFAFALGDSPAEHAFMLNPAKAPKALLGEIGKLKPECGRGTFGTARVEGKMLTLDCEKKLPGLAKEARKMLRERGFKQNNVTVLIGGVVEVEESGEPGVVPEGAGEPAAVTAAAPAPSAPPPPPAVAVSTVNTKALATAAAAWHKSVKLAESEIQKLRAKIVGQFKSTPSARDLAQATKGLDDALSDLRGSGWERALENAVADASPENVAELRAQATRMRRAIEKNGILDMVDNNPFTPVKAKKTLLGTLDVIEARLAK